jgi:D-alanyl-D-alanine carboxypeptidase
MIGIIIHKGVMFFSKQKVYLLISLTFLLLLSLEVKGWAAKKAISRVKISARSVIFSNSTKTKRLYGKNIHTRVPPASTVKVLTALLVLERLSLDKIVSVSSHALYPQPSKIHVKAGEQYDVKSLLYAVLLNSANDAAVVLAEAVAGSEGQFVALMNKRAKELGCKNTKVVNAHGLPHAAPQYTTAYDMYLIFREALKYPFFRQAIAYQRKNIYSQAGRKIMLTSHNDILFSKWKQKLYGKTGYTRSAKACFVGYTKKGEDDLIIAIFGCQSGRRWKEIKHIVSSYGGLSL